MILIVNKEELNSLKVRPLTNRDLNRDGSTRTRSSAAAARRATRPGTTPATDVTVGPAGAEASDPARAVATRAPRELGWTTTHHGVLDYHGLDKNRPGQHAQTRRQLSQHNWTHIQFLKSTDRIFLVAEDDDGS